MIRTCSWCLRHIGYLVTNDPAGTTTHGICGPCHASQMRLLDALKAFESGTLMNPSESDAGGSPDPTNDSPGSDTPSPAPESGASSPLPSHAPPGAGDSMCYPEGCWSAEWCPDESQYGYISIRGGQGRDSDDMARGEVAARIVAWGLAAVAATVIILWILSL